VRKAKISKTNLLDVLVCGLRLRRCWDVAVVHAVRVCVRVAALTPPQVLVHVLRQERRERRHHLQRQRLYLSEMLLCSVRNDV